MSGLSEVSRLFAQRAGDLEKAREVFTAESRNYISSILGALQRVRGEPWVAGRVRVDFQSDLETGKGGTIANQSALARAILRFKKGVKFMPIAQVGFGIEFDQTAEAFMWHVTLVPAARYHRLDDVVWRQMRAANLELPGAVHQERANTVRFVQRSLSAELQPETLFNDVKSVLDLVLGSDAALAEAVGVDLEPGEGDDG
jgi:hypothetical protein